MATKRSKSVPKITAKMRHHERLLEYLGNPENEIPNRTEYCDILNIARSTLYDTFTGHELDIIESEALVLRRQRIARAAMEIDKALQNKAKSGDPAAIKLFYQRLEGWSEKTTIDHNIKSIDDIIQEIEGE
jgi:hypothetical protein